MLENKVYFGKKQVGIGVVTHLFCGLLNSVGEIIGI